MVQRERPSRHCSGTRSWDPLRLPGSVRGSHSAEPLPALIDEHWFLRQFLKGLTRDSEVHRFISFRETVIDEGQHLSGLAALSAFGKQ